MDDKINIVKASALVIYTPQEVACIFKEQLKETVKQLKPVELYVMLVLVI